MRVPLVVMDIGDVLVQTIPAAQYYELEAYTKIPHKKIETDIEASGIITAFEGGILTTNEFISGLRSILSFPLLDDQVFIAWNKVVADLDPVIAPLAAQLAKHGQLLLASNTNPIHWRTIQRMLHCAEIIAPACLSFQIGTMKPASLFFIKLIQYWPFEKYRSLYIDDKADNVEVASRYGMIGWIHKTSEETAERLKKFLSKESTPKSKI